MIISDISDSDNDHGFSKKYIYIFFCHLSIKSVELKNESEEPELFFKPRLYFNF